MIQIEMTFALALYSGILAVLVSMLWMYTEFFVRRPQRHLGEQFLWRCIYCNFTYLDESAERISECPRCHSLNALEDRNPRTPERAKVAERNEGVHNSSRKGRHHRRRRGPRRRRGGRR